MRHTPGPWYVMENGFTSKPGSVWHAPTVYATDDELRYVAVCACADFGNFGVVATDNKANARLIAAVPNLLDLLTRAVETHGPFGDDTRPGWWEEACAVIGSLQREGTK